MRPPSNRGTCVTPGAYMVFGGGASPLRVVRNQSANTLDSLVDRKPVHIRQPNHLSQEK